jgi:hypothetical protein
MGSESDHGNGDALHRNSLLTPPSQVLSGAGNGVLWTRSLKEQNPYRSEEGRGRGGGFMRYLIRSCWILRTSKVRAHSIVTISNGRDEDAKKKTPPGTC